MIDYYIAPGLLRTICTCRPVNHTCSLNGYTKEFFFYCTSSRSTFVFSLQLPASSFDNRLRRYTFLKAAFNFLHSFTNTSPDEERKIDLGTFVDEEEGDIDGESDVELDGNDQLDLSSRSRLGAQ